MTGPVAPPHGPVPAGPREISTGPLSPLATPTFLWFWLAFTIASVAISMQAIGAQWFLVDAGSGADHVALVQASLTLPLALLSLPAGVLADRLDPRRLLIAFQAAALVAGLALTAVSFTDVLGPNLLLVLTLLLGSAYALTLTPFQAVVPEVVPRPQIQAAAALTSIAANVARVLGPSTAGVLIAWLGVPAVFALSAMTSAFFLAVLLRWSGMPRAHTQREPFLPAMRSGIRFVRHSPQVLKLMARGAWFTFAMSSIFALLPLVATDQLGAGPNGYGVLFACLGAGAVLGGFSISRMRHRLSDNRIVAIGFTVAALDLGALPFIPWLALGMPCLFVAGWAWTTCLSTIMGNLQLYLPTWVRARGIAVFTVAQFSGQTLGAVVLGAVAEQWSLAVAFWCAAGVLAVGVSLARVLPVVQLEGVDRTPTVYWHEPVLVVTPDEIGGEVVVAVEYWVDPEDDERFRRGMRAVRRMRMRTGANHWRLMRDAEAHRRYVEEYTVGSWGEHELQLHTRLVASDHALESVVTALSDPPPRVIHLFRVGLE